MRLRYKSIVILVLIVMLYRLLLVPQTPQLSIPIISPTVTFPFVLETPQTQIFAVPLSGTPIPWSPVGKKFLDTEWFSFYGTSDSIPAFAKGFLSTQADRIFAKVNFQLGVNINSHIVVSFETQQQKSGCYARGLASTDSITIFTDENFSKEQLLAVLSHEVGHIVHRSSMGDDTMNFPSLTEGLATWISRDYWNLWQGSTSLQESVQSYIADGMYLPLSLNEDLQLGYNNEDCLVYRDILYTEWATFIDFLIDKYGMEKFKQLLKSENFKNSNKETGQIHKPDYQTIYGISLDILEHMWLLTLEVN